MALDGQYSNKGNNFKSYKILRKANQILYITFVFYIKYKLETTLPSLTLNSTNLNPKSTYPSDQILVMTKRPTNRPTIAKKYTSSFLKNEYKYREQVIFLVSVGLMTSFLHSLFIYLLYPRPLEEEGCIVQIMSVGRTKQFPLIILKTI